MTHFICLINLILYASRRHAVTGESARSDMKTRRHHNNKGIRQIKTGSYVKPLKRLARKLGVPFRVGIAASS